MSQNLGGRYRQGDGETEAMCDKGNVRGVRGVRGAGARIGTVGSLKLQWLGVCVREHEELNLQQRSEDRSRDNAPKCPTDTVFCIKISTETNTK
jgi:hypothetical protein